VFDEAHNLLDAVNGAHGASITGALPPARAVLCVRALRCAGRRRMCARAVLATAWHA
jgi:hypothetical protein